MELNNTQLREILYSFSVPEESYQLVPLTNGLINDTFLVTTHQQPVYVLQRINTSIFKDVNGLMNNISKALKKLQGLDYQAITLATTTANHNSYYNHPQWGVWRLMSFIPDSTTYNTTTHVEVAFEAGKTISSFHYLLKDVPIDEFAITIPKFHSISHRKSQFLKVLATTDQDRMTSANSAIQFAKQMLPKLTSLTDNAVPLRLCHNDTKLNNILFSKADNSGLCLIDLDTLMEGFVYYDFGDAARTIVNTVPEDEKDVTKICFRKDLFEAFVKGWASTPSFLTTTEISALPVGVVLMPFLHGLRALTDYLEYNKYYKVSYPNQNLDRCLSLFEFSKYALNHYEYMENTVNTYLNKRC